MDGIVSELVAGGTLAVYTMVLIAGVSAIYEKMREMGMGEGLAVYISRKLIHALAAGIATLIVPLVFNTPLIPAALSTLLAVALLAARRRGGMRWFQTSRDANEVTFVLSWAASLTAVWLATRNMTLAIIPPLFISIGDAVTGFARAAIVGRREKHWIGNLAMAAFTVPVGVLLLGPLWGSVTGLAAAIAEKMDRPVDDNVAVALVTTMLVVAAAKLG